MCILNDWSARDIQAWEYQPLGPFLAKSFATTISPWVVTMDALAPYRIAALARPADDPKPMPYLHDAEDQATGGLDISIDVLLESEAMRRAGEAPHRFSSVRFKDLYWTVAQFVAHHTSNGCDLRPGDLLGSGTVSSPQPGALGSLMELSNGGRDPLRLPNGEMRTFLEDGDAVIFRAHCEREGAARIGFGECRATIEAAVISA
jgi:fumarylacetoacetase